MASEVKSKTQKLSEELDKLEKLVELLQKRNCSTEDVREQVVVVSRLYESIGDDLSLFFQEILTKMVEGNVQELGF